MTISLLAAYTKNEHIIGAQGKIPWKLPSERNYFKKICNNKFVLMGRKSFDEIGKPLSYCNLIVLTKNNEKKSLLQIQKDEPSTSRTIPPIQFASSLEEAFELCKDQEEILIAGGQSLYEQTLPIANKIYATEINLKIKGDSYFPQINSSWKKTILESKTENGISYDYVIYEKK